MKISTKSISFNLLLMAGVVLGICLVSVLCLSLYTHHGQSIAVPNVKGMNIQRARTVLEDAGLDCEVSDTGYVKSLPPDCILEQFPESGLRVKGGRIIRLVINASETPSLTLPDIIDNSSLREAMARLKTMGFRLGQPRFVDGEKDWVYGVLVEGRSVSTGDRVSLDKELILEVGNGNMNSQDSVTYVDKPQQPLYDNSTDDGLITEDDGF